MCIGDRVNKYYTVVYVDCSKVSAGPDWLRCSNISAGLAVHNSSVQTVSLQCFSPCLRDVNSASQRLLQGGSMSLIIVG